MMSKLGLTGPRFIEPHQTSKISEKSMVRYREALQEFTTWALDHSYYPETQEEYDDLLAEFCHEHPDLTRSKFGNTVAGVEFFFPRVRGKLCWAHAILSGWDAGRSIRHTVPLGKGLARLLACHFCAWGHSRIAIALVLQSCTGLRPSELLKLLSDDLLFPEEEGYTLDERPLRLSLGTKKGTKSKRAQFVLVDKTQRRLALVLRALKRLTPPGLLLFPISYSSYRLLIKAGEEALGLAAGFTPHSPRAGFASDSRAEGWSFEEIRETGRWVSDSSLRIYLDIVGSSGIGVSVRAAGLSPALEWARNNWVRYLVPSDLAFYA